MVVLYIYIGSVAYALVVNTIYSAAAIKYIKRHGYEFIKEKKSFVEMLSSHVSVLVICGIPLLNILTPTYMALSGAESIAEKTIPKLLQKGKIQRVIIPREDVNCENINNYGKTEEYSQSQEKVVVNENGFKVTVVELNPDQYEDKGPTRKRSKFDNGQ